MAGRSVFFIIPQSDHHVRILTFACIVEEEEVVGFSPGGDIGGILNLSLFPSAP